MTTNQNKPASRKHKQRVDIIMVERGIVESRAKAQALIMSGEVLVNGVTALKPGTLIPEDSSISIVEPPPFVSRGGIKLDYALEQFKLDVNGKIVADIGASTGGFTDCLLKRGVRRVYAIDVGYGQIDYRLRQDPRVVVMEGINARYPISLPEKVDLATMDLSFISLEKVIPSIMAVTQDGGYLVALFKPQFEARRKEVGKGGIIKNPVLHATIIGRFIYWVTHQKLRLKGLIPSPILGASGNREFFILLKLTDAH